MATIIINIPLILNENLYISDFKELPYGGWVAPNIFYLGYAGVIEVNGIRIGGLSGIYKGHDYLKGRYERPPYDGNTQRSVYHIRNLDVFRLKQLSKNPPDIFLSHDWPRGIHKHGDAISLLRQKPFFKEDIDKNALGKYKFRNYIANYFFRYNTDKVISQYIIKCLTYVVIDNLIFYNRL